MPILPAQISMVQQGEAKSIVRKWVQNIACMGLIDAPILSELFRAEHEDAFITRLEELDGRQSLKRLPQTDAVSQDAAVMSEDLVDGPLDTVLLKIEEGISHLALEQRGLTQAAFEIAGVFEKLLEHMEQGLIVEKLG